MANRVDVVLDVVDNASPGLANIGRNLLALPTPIKVIGAAALGAGAAVLKMSGDYAKAAFELGKLSTQTGVAVKNLSQLQYAAKSTGVEMEDVKGLLEEMNIRLGEKHPGMMQTLESIGVSVRELNGLAPDEQFIKISNALQSAGLNASQMGFAVDELFGGDGFKALPLITSDIEKLRVEADALGVTMDRRGVEAAKKYQQAQARLGAAFEGIRNTVGEALLPVITELTNFIVEQALPVWRSMEPAITRILTIFGKLARVVGTVVLQGFRIATGVISGFVNLLASVPFVKEIFVDVNADQATQEIDDVKTGLGDIEDAKTDITGRIDSLIEHTIDGSGLENNIAIGIQNGIANSPWGKIPGLQAHEKALTPWEELKEFFFKQLPTTETVPANDLGRATTILAEATTQLRNFENAGTPFEQQTDYMGSWVQLFRDWFNKRPDELTPAQIVSMAADSAALTARGINPTHPGRDMGFGPSVTGISESVRRAQAGRMALHSAQSYSVYERMYGGSVSLNEEGAFDSDPNLFVGPDAEIIRLAYWH